MLYNFDKKVFAFNPAAFLDYDQYQRAGLAVMSMTGDPNDTEPFEGVLMTAWDLEIVAVCPTPVEDDQGEMTGGYLVLRSLPPTIETAKDLALTMGPLYHPSNLSVKLTVEDTVSPGSLQLIYLVSTGSFMAYRLIMTEGESLAVWQAGELDEIDNVNERDLVRLLVGIATNTANEFSLRRIRSEWEKAAQGIINETAALIGESYRATGQLPPPDPDNPYQPLVLAMYAKNIATIKALTGLLEKGLNPLEIGPDKVSDMTGLADIPEFALAKSYIEDLHKQLLDKAEDIGGGFSYRGHVP